MVCDTDEPKGRDDVLWATPGASGEVSEYIAQCQRFKMPVDPTVAIGLQFRSETLQISASVAYEGCLLPLYSILTRSKTITYVSLYVCTTSRSCALGNSNATVLGKVLEQNDTIQTLDLRYAGISEVGMADLCKGLRENNHLQVLLLRGNYLSDEGGRMLLNVIVHKMSKGARQLKKIDVSCCGIGSYSSRHLRSALTGQTAVDMKVPNKWQMRRNVSQEPHIIVNGNFQTEEMWNAISHGIGTVAAIIGSVLLLRQVSENPIHHIWGCVLFSMSLIFMFLMSTLLHSLFLYEDAYGWFQILDHSAIFILIAGSYSPYLLFYSLESHLSLLRVQWWLCAIGVVLHVLSQYYPWGMSRLYTTSELVLYVVMGYNIFLVWDTLALLLPESSSNLLVAGGISYTLGIPFFVLGEYYPICHAIWHLFVIIAAVCHWFSVRDAASDALKNHSQGPFTEEIQQYMRHISQIKRNMATALHQVQEMSGQGTQSLLWEVQASLASQMVLFGGLLNNSLGNDSNPLGQILPTIFAQSQNSTVT